MSQTVRCVIKKYIIGNNIKMCAFQADTFKIYGDCKLVR